MTTIFDDDTDLSVVIAAQAAEKAEAEKKPAPKVTGLTMEEMSETLTGFDELAIAKAFGKEFSDLQGTKFVRSLIMIWLKRTDDLNDGDAYQRAMDLSLKDCAGYFEPDNEIDADHPETESGKDN